MKVKVITQNGQVFESADTKASVEKVAESLYDIVDNIDKFKIITSDGSIIVFPKETIQNSVLIFEK